MGKGCLMAGSESTTHGFPVSIYGTAMVPVPDFSRFTSGMPLNLRVRFPLLPTTGEHAISYEVAEAVGDTWRHNQVPRGYGSDNVLKTLMAARAEGRTGLDEARRWYMALPPAVHDEIHGLVKAEVALMVEEAAEGITVDWRDQRDRLESVMLMISMTPEGKAVADEARATVDAYRVDGIPFEPSERLASTFAADITAWWACYNGDLPWDANNPATWA
jgi:hypothetical protein